MKDIFIGCFRKVLLLNRNRKAKLEQMLEVKLEKKKNKERLLALKMNKKNSFELSTKLFKYFLGHEIDLIAPIENCMQEGLAYIENVDACFQTLTH